jgi:signal transduction histidine kinase/ligand-binding sensor domain-containing protein/CheY-like chemotaxis protein
MRSFPPVAAACVLLSCLGGTLGAQQTIQAMHPISQPGKALPYSGQRWTVADGLPQGTVVAMKQTADGLIWLGTFGGPARFDGVSFRTIDGGFFGARTGQRVTCMHRRRNGELLIGSEDSGLTVLRAGRLESLAPDNVEAVTETADGSIWFLTERDLRRVAGDGTTAFGAAAGLEPRTLQCLLGTRHGELLVGTRRGIYRMHDGQALLIPGSEPGDGGIEFLFEDDHAEVYAGCGSRLLKLDRAGMAMTLVADLGAMLTSMVEDHDGTFWIGTHRGPAFWRPTPGTPASPELCNDGADSFGIVRTLLVDREGSIWIGTNDRGVIRIRRSMLEGFPLPAQLARQGFGAVLGREDGTILVGTLLGPIELRNGRFHHEPAGLPPGSFPETRALLRSKDGALWIGYSKSVARVHEGRVQNFAIGNAGDLSFIRALAEDAAGVIWCGGRGGIWRFADGAFVRAARPEDLADDDVHCIVPGPQDALWIGSGRGVTRLAGGRFRTWHKDRGGPQAAVRAIHFGSRGEVWCGTYGAGLVLLAEGSCPLVGTEQGLCDDNISAMVSDGAGHLFLNTNSGIGRIEESELAACAANPQRQIRCRRYGLAPGMSSAEAQGGNSPPAWRDASGKIWFATIEGLAAIDPTAPYREAPAPLAGFEIEGSQRADLVTAAAMPLPLGRRDLRFSYTAPTFVQPAAARFRYRLLGQHDDWVPAGNRRTAMYANLAPGRYRLEVEASSGDGAWSEAPAVLEVSVPPFYYETPWFRLLAAAATVGLVLALVALRTRGARARARTLEKQVEQRTADLRHEVDERRNAEDELRQNRDLLEVRVRERTAELEQAIEHQRAEHEARMQLEERLREGERLESLGRLAGGVAHDFNNLLTAIQGFAELADAQAEDAQASRSYLREIRSASDSAARLVAQLLAFARRQAVQPCVTSWNEQIEALGGMVRRMVGADVDASFDLTRGAWQVFADPTQLGQVIINLCANARDAVGPGGKVSITTRNVTTGEPQSPTEPPAGEWSELTVADNGDGMDEETLAHAFEPFFTTKPTGRGTGLGLSTCYGIAQLWKGRIAIESRPGAGTRVKVLLPRTHEAVRRSTQAIAPPKTRSAVVLVVDDVQQVRAVTRQLLLRQGFQVLEAADGDEAERIARDRQGPIHLLLTDVVMPKRSGREVAEVVTALHPETRVLFMSGYAESVIAHRGLIAPGISFLQKPFTLDVLNRAITAALGSRPPEPA